MINLLVFLLFCHHILAGVVVQFSDRIEEFKGLLDRNKRWAYINNYEYRLESVRKWPERSVYFEKVRMTIEALEGGAEWVLFSDDDAFINIATQTVEEWIEKYPDKDFIISTQGNLQYHAVTVGHYHNWGVFIAKRTPWMLDILHSIYESEICADVQVSERVGNPEQDCFIRYVYNTPLKLLYPFENINKTDKGLSINSTTLSHVGEPPSYEFNCISDDFHPCKPKNLETKKLGTLNIDDVSLCVILPSLHYLSKIPDSDDRICRALNQFNLSDVSDRVSLIDISHFILKSDQGPFFDQIDIVLDILQSNCREKGCDTCSRIQLIQACFAWHHRKSEEDAISAVESLNHLCVCNNAEALGWTAVMYHSVGNFQSSKECVGKLLQSSPTYNIYPMICDLCRLCGWFSFHIQLAEKMNVAPIALLGIRSAYYFESEPVDNQELLRMLTIERLPLFFDCLMNSSFDFALVIKHLHDLLNAIKSSCSLRKLILKAMLFVAMSRLNYVLGNVISALLLALESTKLHQTILNSLPSTHSSNFSPLSFSHSFLFSLYLTSKLFLLIGCQKQAVYYIDQGKELSHKLSPTWSLKFNLLDARLQLMQDQPLLASHSILAHCSLQLEDLPFDPKIFEQHIPEVEDAFVALWWLSCSKLYSQSKDIMFCCEHAMHYIKSGFSRDIVFRVQLQISPSISILASPDPLVRAKAYILLAKKKSIDSLPFSIPDLLALPKDPKNTKIGHIYTCLIAALSCVFPLGVSSIIRDVCTLLINIIPHIAANNVFLVFYQSISFGITARNESALINSSHSFNSVEKEFELFIDILRSLPINLCIISVSVVNECVCVSRIESGLNPIFYSHNCPVLELKEKFDSIMKAANDSTHQWSPDQSKKFSTDSMTVKSWWRNRFELDQYLKSFLKTIETNIFGDLAFILRGSPVEKVISQSLLQRARDACVALSAIANKNSMCYLLINYKSY